MRSRILTDTEKKVITAYLQSETKLDGYRMTLSRCKKFLPQSEEDLALIRKFLEKVG